MGLSLFDERAPFEALSQIVAADTTTLKAILPSQSGAYLRFDNLLLSSTDSIDHKVVFWKTASAVNYAIGSVDLPAGSGHGGLAAVDAIPLLVAAGQQGILFTNFATLSFSVEVTVTGGSVQCVSMGGSL